MASSSGKLPYAVRAEGKTKLSWYHEDHICGSSLHGLAQTIQSFLHDGLFDESLSQIERCIDARLEEANKRSFPDRAHNEVIEQLRKFHTNVKKLRRLVQTGDTTYADKLKTVVIRYIEREKPHRFEITIGNFGQEEEIAGGRRGRTRRGKTRRGKTRKSKTKASKKNSYKHRKSKRRTMYKKK